MGMMFPPYAYNNLAVIQTLLLTTKTETDGK